jgi:hypothetical protein
MMLFDLPATVVAIVGVSSTSPPLSSSFPFAQLDSAQLSLAPHFFAAETRPYEAFSS